MAGRRALVAAVMMLTTAACAGAPPTPDPAAVPFTMQPQVPRLGAAPAGFDVDHVTVDGSGAYVCVLRRGNDLAGLRARYNVPVG